MKPLRRILTLFFCLLTLSSAFAQQIPVKRYTPDFSSPNPYGLVNLDASISSPDYFYANRGVPMSSGAFVILPFQTFSFTKLTAGPYSSMNTEIIMLPDIYGSTVLTASQFVGAQWSGSTGSTGFINFTPSDYQPANAILLRKYNFPQSLPAVNGAAFSDSTKKAIILIHGWNPDSDNDSYDNAVEDKEFYALKESIKSAIQNSPNCGWQLLTYRWERDADTGGGVFEEGAFDAAVNGSEAAESGHRHGQHLGQLLDTLSQQKIERIHFIAHSAGSWVARGATKYLLSARQNDESLPRVKIQISLLDPFIPGDLDTTVSGRNSQLDRARMSEIKQFYGANESSLYRLENYYAEDEAVGTNGVFDWRESDENGKVVGGDEFLADTDPMEVYQGHSGPVQYYADTVMEVLSNPSATITSAKIADAKSRLNESNLARTSHLYGWQRSLFYREPVFVTEPSAAPVAVGASVDLASFAKIRGGTNYGREIKYEWQTSTNNFANLTVVPNTDPFYSSLRVENITAAQNGRQYRCRAYTDAGEAFSRTVVISVIGGSTPVTPPATAPVAPTNLTATAVSASQINLRWTDNASNETGFKLQRRTATGTFADISTAAAANSTAFSNTAGLSSATTYFYRIRAFNSTGDSAYSGEASATTLAGASATYTLTVEAVNLDTGAAMSVPVYTWLGASTDIREQTTTFTRAFTTGAEVKIAAFPTASGKQFKYMQSGGDVRSADTWTIPMTGNKTVVIAYGSAATVGKTLTSIAIEGDSSVDENDSESYKARATYSDGTSALVSASDWDITSGSSYADISSSGRLDAEAVSSDRSITIEASYTAGGTTKTATKSVTIRNSVSAQTYTLTRNVVGSGEIGYSPKATSYAAGTVVSLHGNEGDGYVFDHWSGDASGTDDDITIRMDRDRTVTAHFVVDTSVGHIRVDISPPQAVAEGAQWRYDNFTAWRPSGDLQDFIATRTNRNVRFKDIPGWITPENAKASIVGGQTTVVSGAAATYREILGAVQVTIQPSQAATAGARWRLDGGAWQESSVTLPNASTGSHTIEFLAIPGWATPPSQNIAVARGITTTRSGDYGPPAGFPIITSVSPKTGPIEGGTTVTIEGANFQPGAAVTFGGVAATSVTLISPAKLTAVTPPRPSYGTVPLVLTSGGQPVPLGSGFTYDVPAGVNMTLLSQIGGTVGAVAASGNLVLYGEGTSLVAADFTTPATPVIRGRLPLRGIILDIEILGSHAIVATGRWGVQVVDISDMNNLRLVGFYDTPGWATRLALSGNLVFVADQTTGGVQVLDVTNREAPVRVGQYLTPSAAQDIGLSMINGKLIACVGMTQGAALLDVTNAGNIMPLNVVEPTAFNPNVAIDGMRIAIGGVGTGKVYDISDPFAPIQIGSSNNIASGVKLIRNSVLYVCSSGAYLANLASLAPPSSIVPRLGSVGIEGDCNGLALQGSTLFMANGAGGLVAVDVSNVTTPVVRTTTNRGFGAGHVEVSGNTAFVSHGGSYSSGGPSTFSIPVLTAVDVTVKTSPVLGGTAFSNSTLEDIRLVNNYLYGPTQYYGVHGFSVQNPLTPTFASARGADRTTFCISRLGQNIIIGGETDETIPKPQLSVFDGANPSNATPLATLQLSSNPGGVWGVAVSGTTVFALVYGVELRIYNYSNYTAPVLLSATPFAPYIRGAAVSDDGNTLFVTGGTNGLTIFDCTNRAAPTIAATFSRSGYANGEDVVVRGSLVFYSDTRFVNVLDVSNIHQPVLVASYDNGGTPYGLAVVGDDVFVASGSGGLALLRLGDINLPVIEIVTPVRSVNYETTSALITLGGTATDLQGVVRVTWENDRGGGGVAQGTTAWSIAGIQLAAGANVLTVTAEDANGNLARDSITVTATLPETDGPALLVTGPKPPPAFTFPADTLPLTGTAADASGVQSIAWANDRGGSGPATGTTAWNADIPLFEGPNRITLTALDTVGNESQTEVLVTYLPPDATAPTVGITFPTDAQEATTTDPLANLSGEADDDRAVSRVSWASSRGGSGEATGARAWHINGIVLQPGVNILTITVEDAAGNTGTDTLAVTFAPTGSDPARPVLAVQTPAAKPLVTEQNHIACTGQASGGSAITEAIVQTNDGPWSSVTGTANWTADLPLAPGRNVLRFKAIDATGRESLPVERVVTYRKLAALALATTGQGTPALSGKPDLAALEVGKLYTADAKPAKGWIFAGWEGAVVSNSKRVSFVMEEGATLNAVFLENPYDELAAVYHGLLRADPLAHATSGAMTIALTKSGAFTAKFIIGGEKLRLKGSFDGTGSFLGELKASRTQTFDVLLALDTATPDSPVTGLLSDGTTTMALNAWPTVKFPRNTPAAQAGEYTLAIEPGTAPAPLGSGFGTASVSAGGGVKLKGRLANGAKFSAGTAITSGNRVPVYVSLDKGSSSFSAPLAFADKPDSDLDGIAFWSSARETSAKYQFAPFTSEPGLFAQRYTPPARGERALSSLNATNGAVTLTLGTHTQLLTLGTDNRLTFGNPLLDGFSMTLKPKTGEFSGSLLLDGERTNFGGVLLQKSGDGVGSLPDAAVTLEP